MKNTELLAKLAVVQDLLETAKADIVHENFEEAMDIVSDCFDSLSEVLVTISDLENEGECI